MWCGEWLRAGGTSILQKVGLGFAVSLGKVVLSAVRRSWQSPRLPLHCAVRRPDALQRQLLPVVREGGAARRDTRGRLGRSNLCLAGGPKERWRVIVVVRLHRQGMPVDVVGVICPDVPQTALAVIYLADYLMHQKCPGQICPDLGSDLGQIRTYPSVTLPRSAQMFPQICPDPHQHLPTCAPHSAQICPVLWGAGRSLSE
eukprot:gene23141-biopygen23807